MITKKELEAHVVNTQMIKRGVCGKDEVKERQKVIKHLESQPDFFSPYNDSKRLDISKGVVKRRNAAYKMLIDSYLGREEGLRLERYIYFCLTSETLPNPGVITLSLNIPKL